MACCSVNIFMKRDFVQGIKRFLPRFRQQYAGPSIRTWVQQLFRVMTRLLPLIPCHSCRGRNYQSRTQPAQSTRPRIAYDVGVHLTGSACLLEPPWKIHPRFVDFHKEDDPPYFCALMNSLSIKTALSIIQKNSHFALFHVDIEAVEVYFQVSDNILAK